MSASIIGSDPVRWVLELARRHLGMDVAFLAEFTDGKQVYRGLAGDADSFGWHLDDGPTLDGTFCRLMTNGQIPNVIPDAGSDPRTRALPVTAQSRIGSYVGVPLRLPDGALYGSLCCVSHQATGLDQRDADLLALLAELLIIPVQAQRAFRAEAARIRALIDGGRLRVAAQPIVDVRDGTCLGVEALSRFPAGHGGPDAVFAAAHAVGLGAELEHLAVTSAYPLLDRLGPSAYLAINLSPEVAYQLARDVDTGALPLHRMVLEITEHAAVTHYADLRERLAPARAAGLRVAIDDAGAGYASLHHIVELSPDIIKVDRSLIAGLDTDPSRRAVLAAFTSLAAGIGATLVAEGVETPGELRAAVEHGVHAAQGYLLARPSTNPTDLHRWVSDGLTLPGAATALRRASSTSSHERMGGGERVLESTVARDSLEELAERTFSHLSRMQDQRARRSHEDFLPLVAASHFAGHFATTGWANRCGLHAVSLGLGRQLFETLSIIELGFLGEGGRQQLVRWNSGKVTMGGLRSWLQGNAWPGYPAGLSGTSWTDFMVSLGRALQPYAHFSPALLQWNFNMVAAPGAQRREAVVAVGPSYDAVRAARIQLLRGTLLWALGQVMRQREPALFEDGLGKDMDILGSEGARSEWLVSVDWDEVLTPHIWDAQRAQDCRHD